MTNLDVVVLERAGFRVITKQALDYADEQMARSYLQWGFKSPAEVEAQAAFAVEVMGVPPGSRVLDIGCGNGVAAVKLAALGYSVTGLDISPVFIEAGKQLAVSQGAPAINWVCADFYASSPGAHDAAILLDSALQVAQPEFTSKLSECVRPGGGFFLRYKGGVQGTSNWPSRWWRYEPEGCALCLEQHTLDRVTSALKDEWIRVDFAAREVTVERCAGALVLFSRFVEIMDEAGLALSSTWGNTDGSPVTENSRIYAHFTRRG